jgi:starch phosphorylase
MVPVSTASTFASFAQMDDPVAMRAMILDKLTYAIGKDPGSASKRDWFVATVLAVRDLVVERWLASERDVATRSSKRVYYLSLEFLIGRLLGDALNNLGLTPTVRAALSSLGLELDELELAEPDAALGNGGLGRLAACFMDSMAALSIPACGYGIRYQHGLFRQLIEGGQQAEVPETWLRFGNPWEFERAEVIYDIHFGGHVTVTPTEAGPRHVWIPGEVVNAVAYDTPIVGWRGAFVNRLRLWAARAPLPIHLESFNRGDYLGAVRTRAQARSIDQLLYPSDETPAGQELRLRQEYFFSSASLQDLVHAHLAAHGDLRSLPDHAAIQLNDTHPAIAIPELMRLAVDVHGLDWDTAWSITRRTFSYTNHTLLPEALESWPVELMETLLPRHMQIIYTINALHLDALRREGRAAAERQISLIEEEHGRRVRMGSLSFIGSHRVNGVSALHTELMRRTVFHHLHELYPEKIVNKTNGITFRRWLHTANPGLTSLLVELVGPDVLDDPGALHRLARHAGDGAVHEALRTVKLRNKGRLAARISDALEIAVDPHALFDVHVKRIHEYKRQLLNILETVSLYLAIRDDPQGAWVPRVKIFAGKAAASYRRAKLIIRLINDVAARVNADSKVGDLLRVAFLPNYNVSLAEVIIPAADLSEQISTAGMEASGTGNMKLALNGALTVGTLDGANVELKEHVGEDNIFIFGMTAEEVAARRAQGLDQQREVAASPRLARALEAIESGEFSPDDPQRYRELSSLIRYSDPYMTAADFDSYAAAQLRIADCWRNEEAWQRASLLNIASVGWFSSDRTIAEYADEIWHVPVHAPIRLASEQSCSRNG